MERVKCLKGLIFKGLTHEKGEARNVMERLGPHEMVERRRIELPTSALRTQRSPS